MIPEQWRLIYSLNPMAGVIDGFRWALLGSSSTLNRDALLLSTGIILIMLLSGFLFFRKTEKSFADVI